MNPFITYHVVTLFPDYFSSPLQQGLLCKAIAENRVAFKIYNLRDYSPFKHRQVDDEGYGGGPGMVLRMEPLVSSLKSIRATLSPNEVCEGVALTPSGEKLTQTLVNTYGTRIQNKQLQHLIVYCGRYEGFDERFLTHYVDRRLRIGDCVFMGGEVGALLLGEAISRLLPGVVGNEESLKHESFLEQNEAFDYPVYTRPPVFEGLEVPKILLSGNHAQIEQWRHEQAQKQGKELPPKTGPNVHKY